jgi:ATP-independent RNA helicase DbpA
MPQTGPILKNLDFNQLPLKPEILKNLDLLGFEQMTDIQAKALPHVLGGKDVVAQAQTGSGKTVAFGLGVLSRTTIADYYIQSIVLCPTRELATQVATEIRRLGRLSSNLKVLILCGGMPMGPQIESLNHGAHVIVGTPGRILDHMSKRTLDLRNVKTLVLDEADRMLDMGFAEDIAAIISRTPNSRQTLLFSATFPENIMNMSRDIQKNPVHVKTENATQNTDIDQYFFETKKDEQFEVLLSLIDKYRPESSIIFCTTKIQCDDVAKYLTDCGLVALPLHGDLEQYERDEVMVRFSNKSASILVATDVAARGLDIKDLSAVINFEISKDPEIHVHRIGRTGRAGQKGLALTMYNRSEVFRIKAIEKLMGVELTKDTPLPRIKGQRVDLKPEMKTLKISGGKKNKLRPGDILGALTKEAGIEGQYIGKINVFDFHSYVAIHKQQAEAAQRRLDTAKIKNRNFRMKILW